MRVRNPQTITYIKDDHLLAKIQHEIKTLTDLQKERLRKGKRPDVGINQLICLRLISEYHIKCDLRMITPRRRGITFIHD